jgi:hypothetical protein
VECCAIADVAETWLLASPQRPHARNATYLFADMWGLSFRLQLPPRNRQNSGPGSRRPSRPAEAFPFPKLRTRTALFLLLVPGAAGPPPPPSRPSRVEPERRESGGAWRRRRGSRPPRSSSLSAQVLVSSPPPPPFNISSIGCDSF